MLFSLTTSPEDFREEIDGTSINTVNLNLHVDSGNEKKRVYNRGDKKKKRGVFGSSYIKGSISSNKARGCFSSKTPFVFLPRSNQIQWMIT